MAVGTTITAGPTAFPVAPERSRNVEGMTGLMRFPFEWNHPLEVNPRGRPVS